MLSRWFNREQRRAAKQVIDWLTVTPTQSKAETTEQVVIQGELLEEMINVRGWKEIIEPRMADYVNRHIEALLHCKPEEYEEHRQAVLAFRHLRDFINGSIKAGRETKAERQLLRQMEEEFEEELV